MHPTGAQLREGLVDKGPAALGRIPPPPRGGMQPVAQLRVVVRVLRRGPQMEPAEERAGPFSIAAQNP
jgi:hypothetical protein